MADVRLPSIATNFLPNGKMKRRRPIKSWWKAIDETIREFLTSSDDSICREVRERFWRLDCGASCLKTDNIYFMKHTNHNIPYGDTFTLAKFHANFRKSNF